MLRDEILKMWIICDDPDSFGRSGGVADEIQEHIFIIYILFREIKKGVWWSTGVARSLNVF